ncbi:hypothetical protein HCN44_002944 [Aphidius gifuensis]|uniref:Uncharacterized protein n=1 Tax=Aphidius gifuensis TaxID=684658 RepID=A0A835CPL8_APHGI|nr:Golgi resident protein GCP60 [Aphidius gifuensis]KAF7991382.1 hypothetical protein HCN44_002944 [Aphidius gifuensis]
MASIAKNITAISDDINNIKLTSSNHQDDTSSSSTTTTNNLSNLSSEFEPHLSGFETRELYKIAIKFYKEKEGKAVHLSYEDKLKLMAFTQQAIHGKCTPENLPPLGVLDVIGKDRRLAWQNLGDITKEQAMEGFVVLLDKLCPLFRTVVEAQKRNIEEQERIQKLIELKNIEDIKRQKLIEQENKRQEEEQQKREYQRRQIQEALNQQTYYQFKAYAEQQYPGNPEQQGVLIRQLQEQHYHRYMQQLHQNRSMIQDNNNDVVVDKKNNENQEKDDNKIQKIKKDELINIDDDNDNDNVEKKKYKSKKNHQNNKRNNKKKLNNDSDKGNDADDDDDDDMINDDGHDEEDDDDDDEDEDDDDDDDDGHDNDNKNENDSDEEPDWPHIETPKMWTRTGVEEFKDLIKREAGDAVIKVGHGETVTVRVPTHEDGSCVFWEFATDGYDIGFGVYFEWTKPDTNQVSVHISESEDDDDENDFDSREDLECGDINGDVQTEFKPSTPPISVIIPVYRRDSQDEVYAGSHEYPGQGVYLLKFDNSYSLWRSKTLYYRVYYTRPGFTNNPT